MKLTELTKSAWKIRREAATKWGCKIMEISWKGCLIMASEVKKTLNLEKIFITCGGSLWEKKTKSGDTIRRVYFKSSTLFTVLTSINEGIACSEQFEKFAGPIYSRIDKDGAWIDCSKNKAISSKASVQAWFKDCEFSEFLGY